MKPHGAELHRQALQAAHCPSTTAAGDLVRLALGCQAAEPDQRATATWLREAAEDGVAAARFKLGLCFAHGIGVERNEAAARSWYLRAAAQGHHDARLTLARLPENA